MNNKGQSLVIFIIILPILLLLFALIWEIGNFGFTINRYEKEIKDTIKYGLDNIDNINEEKLTILLKQNINGKINVEISNKVIKVNVKEKYDNLFNFNNKFDIDITYIGYIENNKQIIKKE